jgi:hypothetical protein
MIRLGLAALLAYSALASAAFADQSYTVLMGKGPSGTMEVKVDADGTRHWTYSYNDRGRGPETVGEERLDARGLPVSLTIKGVDYMKASVEEHFALVDGKASWASGSDDGAGVPGEGKIYLANNGASEDFAILARALLKAPGGELDVLPSGHARIEKTDVVVTLTPGGYCLGLCQDARLYLIDGLGFEPAPIWLTDIEIQVGTVSDPKNELVFEGSSWINTIRKGSEALAPQFIKAQSQVTAERDRAIAKTLQHRPAGPVAFVHATLFDSATANLVPHTTVVVDGNKIAAVGRDGSVKVPSGAEIVDAKGKTLMPGLTDMHVHFGSDTDGRLDILSGVTTTRDMGNDMDELLARRKRFATGESIGPRIWLACLIDGPGKYAGPTKMLISTPEEAHAAVKLCFDDGYEQMKIYSSVDPKLVPVIIADAHQRGMRVSGHIPAGMIMSEAVEEGYDEVQHANMWFLNFRTPDVVAQTNTIVRLKDPAVHAKDLDLKSPEVAKFVALLQAHKTAVDPTLVAFEDDYTGEPKKVAPVFAGAISRMPPTVARGLRGGGMGGDAAQRATYQASFQRFLEFTRKLHDAGIRIEPGTDGMAGFELAHEMEDYVRAGIPANQVLQMATLGDAQVMRHDKEQGSITPGKSADLILIDGDPVANIGNVRNVDYVMKDGVVYDLPGIARSVGIKPR